MRKTSLYRKLTKEDLQGLLRMRKRGGKVPAKKGKGSYNRKKLKQEQQEQ